MLNDIWAEKYEIHIGQVFNPETQTNEPKQKIIITRDQFEVIQYFADTEVDEELHRVYTLNKFKFKVVPYFDQYLPVTN
jgi:hypothetical protein